MSNSQENVKLLYFSGYIRNWRKLCTELGLPLDMKREERERELLINAYKKWKLGMTDKICGAFVFALHDEDENKTYCVRDQVGQKQMFYTAAGGDFLCSGDINELASDSRYKKRLNRRMLQQYLFYGFPIGSETFYEGIFKLMPGHYAEWDGSIVKTVRYWSPVFEPDNGKTPEKWAQEIKNVVEEILGEEKDDPEVPHKESFLSGGVDSSYLLAASDAVCANTVGYVEAGFDESELARRTAEILGRDFSVKMISPEEYFDRIPEVMDKMGQPLGDASAVAFSLGCAAVSKKTKVVFSGEGIDEFFGGYNAHKRQLDPSWTYLTCSHIMSEEYVKSLMLEPDDSVKPAAPVEQLWKEVQGKDELAKKLTVDISLWLEGDIYLNTDRTSTACGVELHTPFSDIRLFNVARRIPSEYKFMNDQNKYVFRMAASSLLPDEVAFRKKVGFPVPVRKWLADEKYNAPVAKALFGSASQKFFDQGVMRALWSDFLEGNDTLWGRIYAIYAFLIWYEMKFDD